MNKICGNCRYWQPEERAKGGSISYRTMEPYCKQIKAKGKPKVIYADNKACMLWKVADPWDLESRQKAGAI